MRSGLKRFQNVESLHVITFSCFHRLPLLDAPGVKGIVEIESEWTAFGRGNQLPEGVRLKEVERSCFPIQAAKWRLGWGTMHRGRTESDKT